MKTAISIPDPVFAAADKLAAKLHMSRSELYPVAVRRFVELHDEQTISNKLNQIYATEESIMDPLWSSVQARSIGRERWK